MRLFLLDRLHEKRARFWENSRPIVSGVLEYFAFCRADQWAIQEVEWRLLSCCNVLQRRRPLLVVILVDRHHPELLFGLADQLWREHTAWRWQLLLRPARVPYVLGSVFLGRCPIGHVFLGARSLIELVLFLRA